MFILLCSPHSFLLIVLLTTSLILIRFFFLVALSLKSPTRGVSINYCIVLYCKPLTEESRYKLQSTENFIDAIKTIQIPDDHKLVSFDVKSLFTSIPLQLALDYCWTTTTYRRHYGPTQPLFDFDVLSVQRQTLQTVSRYSHGLSSFCCCILSCKTSRNKP